MCPNCRAFISTDDRVCPYCNTEVAPRVTMRRVSSDALGGMIPHARFATVVIMLINTGLYIATGVASSHVGGGLSEPDLRTLVDFGAKYAPAVAEGQWWRLITAGFLHGSLLHILMNMWVLFDLGAQVDDLMGTSRFLAVYLISNVTGFTASLFFVPAPSLGASAAIFGLIGAMIGLGLRERTTRGAAIFRFYSRWAIYGIVLSFIPGTDIAAHLGGLVGGFVVGYIAGSPGYLPALERAWQAIAGVCVGVTAVAFYFMVMNLMQVTR